MLSHLLNSGHVLILNACIDRELIDIASLAALDIFDHVFLWFLDSSYVV